MRMWFKNVSVRVVLLSAILFFAASSEVYAVRCPELTRNLNTSVSDGPDVKALQEFLKELGFFPADQETTEHYGPITRAAVGEFQEAHTIAYPGHAGYGRVGPLTRTRIQILCGNPLTNQPTTVEGQAVHVTYPNGGEEWSRDRFKVIKWNMEGSSTTVRIFLVDMSNGFHWDIKDVSSKPGSNQFLWKIDPSSKSLAADPIRSPAQTSGFGHELSPGAGPEQNSGTGPEHDPGLGNNFKIKICFLETAKCDSSDEVFRINRPSTKLLVFVTDPAGIPITYDPLLAALDPTMKVGALLVGENVQMNFHNEARKEDIKGIFEFDHLPYGLYQVTGSAKNFMPANQKVRLNGNHCFIMVRLMPGMILPFQPPGEPPRPPVTVCADIPAVPSPEIPDELLPPTPPVPDLGSITPTIRVTNPRGGEVWQTGATKVIAWEATPSVSTDPLSLLPIDVSFTVKLVGYASSSPATYSLGSTTETSRSWRVGDCPAPCASVPPGKYLIEVTDTMGRSDQSDRPIKIVNPETPRPDNASTFSLSFGPRGAQTVPISAFFDPDGVGAGVEVEVSKAISWSFFAPGIAGVTLVDNVAVIKGLRPGEVRAIAAYAGHAKFFKITVGGTETAPVVADIILTTPGF